MIFICRLSDNVPLRNGHSSHKFSEEPMFIIFLYIVIPIKVLPIK